MPDDPEVKSPDRDDPFIKVEEALARARGLLENPTFKLCIKSDCMAAFRQVVTDQEYLYGTLTGLRAYNQLMLHVVAAAAAVAGRPDSDNLQRLSKAVNEAKKTALRGALESIQQSQSTGPAEA